MSAAMGDGFQGQGQYRWFVGLNIEDKVWGHCPFSANRERFKAGERAYLDEWAMTEDQKLAVLARDLNRCIALGGNIYFLAKIGATDGLSFQQMAGSMTGMTEEEYRDMMMAGGRSAEGNRVVGEDGNAQAQHQPQGQSHKKASA